MGVGVALVGVAVELLAVAFVLFGVVAAVFTLGGLVEGALCPLAFLEVD